MSVAEQESCFDCFVEHEEAVRRRGHGRQSAAADDGAVSIRHADPSTGAA